MQNREDQGFYLQLGIFFLTAFGVVLMLLSTSLDFFDFVNSYPHKQPVNVVKNCDLNNPLSGLVCPEHATIEYNAQTKNIELSEFGAVAISKKFRNENLRGSLAPYLEIPTAIIAKTKLPKPKNINTQSIIWIKSRNQMNDNI